MPPFLGKLGRPVSLVWDPRFLARDGAGFWLTAKHFVHEAICVGGISGDTGSKQGPFLGRLSPSLSSSSSQSAEPHLFLK